MNKLTEEDYSKILTLAKEAFNELNIDPNCNLDDLRIKAFILGIINYFKKQNVVIANGELIQLEANVEQEQLKELYAKLDSNFKHQFIVNRDKAQLLFELQLAQKEIKELKLKLKEATNGIQN